MVKPSGYEILLYVKQSGKRKSAFITSNNKGIAIIKKMTFNCFQIDFLNNKYSFTCDEQFRKEMAATLQTVLLGFFIQYNENLLLILHTATRRPKQACHLTLGGIFSEFILHEMDGIVIQ